MESAPSPVILWSAVSIFFEKATDGGIFAIYKSTVFIFYWKYPWPSLAVSLNCKYN